MNEINVGDRVTYKEVSLILDPQCHGKVVSVEGEMVVVEWDRREVTRSVEVMPNLIHEQVHV